MKIGLIGRTELLYNTAQTLLAAGHEIVLILTSKEAPEYKVGANDFERLARKINAKFIKTAKIHEQVGCIADLETMDVAVSVNYSGVIPQNVIDCFRLGILNAHGGDLPRYRGNACQAWAILNGEERIGLCIHRMIGGELDSGDIIAREYFPLAMTTKVTEVWGWMEDRIPSLFSEALSSLAKNPDFFVERQSQSPSDALRCYPRRPEDGRINWQESALSILRLINASNKPYAGAYCEYSDKKMIVWDAELVQDEEVFCAVPGQVTAITSDGCIDVACAKGKIRLACVEYDGFQGRPSPTVIASLRQRLA